MSLAVPPPSVCGSFASSPASSAPSSLFSKTSYATANSDADLEPLPLGQAAPAAARDPSKIRLPLHLPLPPDDLAEVDLSSLVVDDELEGAPIGFAVGKLRSLGPSLLKATTSTCLHIPPGPALPPYLRCTVPFLPDSSSSSAYLPSHILAIRSADSPRTLLLPVHGLLWASASPALDILSARPEKQPPHPSLPTVARPVPSLGDNESTAYLPVIDLNLPSSAAFPSLQGWVYHRSPALLLSALLPSPTSSPAARPSPPSSLSHLLNPEPSPAKEAPGSFSSPQHLTQSLSLLPAQTLLKHVHLVHGLWQNVVALQIADEELWKVMGVAWQILVAALALRERERRRLAATPTTSDEE
ncbi:hypothetical protein JCM8097_002803 [Rhodosporidiobolus ruineniae]